MAIVRLGHTISAISGTLGGTVFRNTRYGPVIAKRPSKVNQHTQRQVAARATQARIVRLWATLTDKQRAAWINTARWFPLKNRLGLRRHISGIQLFTRANIYWAHFGMNPKIEPHRYGPHASAAPLTLNFTAAGGPYNITISNYMQYITFVLVYGSRTLTNHIPAHWPTWTYLDTVGADGPTYDVQPDWDAILGPPQQGEAVGVKIILCAAWYWTSTPTIASTIML